MAEPAPAGARLPAKTGEPEFVAELAAALHAGHSWAQIAARLGQPVRAFRRFWRPRVRQRILELVGPADPPHGTWERASSGRRRDGGCYADGRLCDPCLGAIAGYQARRRAEDTGRVRLPVDPATVELVAKRLHAGDKWTQLAAQAGVTLGFYRDTYRPAVQARCLELADRDDPPAPGEPGHGTYWRYTDARWGCQCEPCRCAVTVYARQRTLDRRRGPAYVPADRARAHVLRLSAQGVGWRQVARQAGVSTGAMSKLLYGSNRRGPLQAGPRWDRGEAAGRPPTGRKAWRPACARAGHLGARQRPGRERLDETGDLCGDRAGRPGAVAGPGARHGPPRGRGPRAVGDLPAPSAVGAAALPLGQGCSPRSGPERARSARRP